MQVKQEVEELICIKEEPEDEQEVMTNLLLDCQVQQGHLPESEVKVELNVKSKNSQHISSFKKCVCMVLDRLCADCFKFYQYIFCQGHFKMSFPLNEIIYFCGNYFAPAFSNQAGTKCEYE